MEYETEIGQQDAGDNAGWRTQFRFAVHVVGPACLSFAFGKAMKTRFYILSVALMLGCRGASPVEMEIRRVEAEGWKYQEIIGRELKEAQVMVHLNADTARALNVKVRSDGQDISREYLQTTNLYYASIFMAPTGGSFALVFSRSRR